MIVSNRNNRLYDIRNFNNYSNIYVIKVNQDKIDNYSQYVSDFLNKCFITYNLEVLILSLGDKNQIKNCLGAYKIIYGHFYNDQDFFLYLDVLNGKLVTHTIKKTQKDTLYFNVDKNLLCRSTFKDINNQFILLNNLLKKTEIEKSDQHRLPLSYEYDPNEYELKFNSGNFIDSVEYSDDCLSIIFNKDKCVINTK